VQSRKRVGAAPRQSPRKKTLVLDQALLDRARRALGARTETETVTQALEGVVQREAQVRGLRELAELGPIEGSRIA
jgi:hypothetical protein